MSDVQNKSASESLVALEQQVEQGGLYTHSVLSHIAERINRIEAFVSGLADSLLDGRQVTEEQLRTRAARVSDELQQKGEMLSAGVVLRVDPDSAPADATVDCGARMHICKAVCCRLKSNGNWASRTSPAGTPTAGAFTSTAKVAAPSTRIGRECAAVIPARTTNASGRISIT